VRAQLSFVLEGVLSQLLLPRAGTPGRVLALEVLVPNAAIRNLIREDKVHQIYTQMQVGQAKHGMQTLNQSLYALHAKRLITLEEALGRSSDVEELRAMIDGRVAGGPGGVPGQAAKA
jgi:twitching motility protein PilT